MTENLGMRKVFAKLVPKVLTDELKDRRVNMCRKLLHCVREKSHGFFSMTRKQCAKTPNGTPPAHHAPKRPT